MSSMIKRKSRALFRGKKASKESGAARKGKPLRFGSGVGFKTPFVRRGNEAPDAYLGAVDASAGFSPALLRQALIMFYTKHNPEKDCLDDTFDILVNYTAKQGLEALNQKLKKKYGESLDDITIPDYLFEDEEDEEDEPPPPGEWGIDPTDEPPPPPQLDGDDLPPPPEEIPDDVLDSLKESLPSSGREKQQGDEKKKSRTKSFFARRKSKKASK